MPTSSSRTKECSAMLFALAAHERLDIIRLLAESPLNVTEITRALGIAPLNVSHHLTVLKSAQLIRGTKRGRFVIYSLAEGVLAKVVEAGVQREAINLGCCCVTLPRVGGTESSPGC